MVKAIEAELSGAVFGSEKKLFAALKSLKNRPRSFKDRKAISKAVVNTIVNREFPEGEGFPGRPGLHRRRGGRRHLRPLARFGQHLSWTWTTNNYVELLASDFTLKILANTMFYVFFTLIFNVGFALVLALATFYMPPGQSKFFRALWLIPRVSPLGHLRHAVEVVYLR